MDFDHLKPVLDDRAVPERRQCATAAEERYGGPPPPRGQHFVLDALHGNSLLLLSLLCRLGDFSAGRSFLFNRFDDAHSHSLPHVTHSKAACEGKMETGRELKSTQLGGQWWLRVLNCRSHKDMLVKQMGEEAGGTLGCGSTCKHF